MKSSKTFVLCLLILSITLFFVACHTTSTPPTFVLAWVNPSGQVKTLESTDAVAFRRSAIDPQATTSSSSIGPAIAHDRQLTWMLMWANGPELQYKVGIGGSTASAGITWEQNIVVGKLTVFPDASPGLAFGKNRWVVVFRRTGGQLFIVRSQESNAAAWETPTDLVHQDVTPRPVVTSSSPALVFGTFNGQELFVLVYRDANMNAVAATSPDGLTWSRPTTIGLSEKDPALSTKNGRLYALLSRQVSSTGVGASSHDFIFKSSDALNWSQIAQHSPTALNATSAGMAYGACLMLVTEWSTWGLPGGGFAQGLIARVGTASNPCDNPTSLNFSTDHPVGVQGQTTAEAIDASARTAVAFGETQP